MGREEMGREIPVSRRVRSQDAGDEELTPVMLLKLVMPVRQVMPDVEVDIVRRFACKGAE